MNASLKLDKFSVITSGVVLLLQVAHNLQLTSSFCERYNSLPQQDVKNKEASYKEERNKTIVPTTSNCQDKVQSSGHWLLATGHFLDHISCSNAYRFFSRPSLFNVDFEEVYTQPICSNHYSRSLRKQPTLQRPIRNTTHILVVTRHQCGTVLRSFSSDVISRRNQCLRREMSAVFFRLFLGKERASTGDLVVATTKNHLAKTAAR